MAKNMIKSCPICGDELAISRLSCKGCDTKIDSELQIHPFFRLPEDLQLFVMTFLRCRGNIRDVEKELGISYPTVCKRLNLVNQILNNQKPAATTRKKILEQLENGEITAKEAAELLKGHQIK
jgi:hypothetical protein